MPLSATLLALSAVLIWSFLAFLGGRVSNLPPFLVVAVALCIGGLAGAFRWRDWRVPLGTFAVGLGGIFGYHFLYFSALQNAPLIEASLLNYLWPLLIVLLSPLFLPGYRLGLHHLFGALLGLCGAALIITGGQLSLDLANLTGYLLAAGAALTWAVYSLLTKRLPPFPTGAVGGFCLASGLLSLAAYNLSGGQFSLGQVTPSEWVYLLLLGAGPLGAAFFPVGRFPQARRPAHHRLAGLPDPAGLHPDPGAVRQPHAHLGLGPGHAADRRRCGARLARIVAAGPRLIPPQGVTGCLPP